MLSTHGPASAEAVVSAVAQCQAHDQLANVCPRRGVGRAGSADGEASADCEATALGDCGGGTDWDESEGLASEKRTGLSKHRGLSPTKSATKIFKISSKSHATRGSNDLTRFMQPTKYGLRKNRREQAILVTHSRIGCV